MFKLMSSLMVVVAVVSIFIGIRYYISTEDVVTVTIKDKERVTDGESSKYLIFTEDEVFENTDDLILGKFNSSDVYKDLDIGKTYTVVVYGWRSPVLSWYRNIVEIQNKE